MITIEIPKKYLYNIDLTNTSQKHHEAHRSYQSFIDGLLIFKRENEDITLNELTIYAKGVLAGRTKKKGRA